MFLDHNVATQALVTYKLSEWDGTPITGTFYERDVLKVHVSDESLFRVEKVFKHKVLKCLWLGRGGQRITTGGFGKKAL